MSCRLLSGHTDIVLALDVSADGHWIGSASKDLCARVWDAVTAKCVAKCAGHVEAVGEPLPPHALAPDARAPRTRALNA
eukprot:3571011-Pleurochrysis_carterae.AAC.1